MLADPFWIGLAAKMATTAALVLVASLLVERTGPFVGAMVATLPISAGPAYAFLAAEHGSSFVAESAVVGLALNAATAIFSAVYAAMALRRGLVASLGAAALVWALVAWTALATAWSLPASVLLNVVVLAMAIAGTRRLREGRTVTRAARRWWDIPLRMAAAMVVVGAVVVSGRLFGPRIAGTMASLPVVFVSLIVVLHPRIGGPATGAVLIHALPGLIGLGAGLFVVHAASVPLGVAPALCIALAACIAWNGSLLLLSKARRGRRGGAATA